MVELISCISLAAQLVSCQKTAVDHTDDPTVELMVARRYHPEKVVKPAKRPMHAHAHRVLLSLDLPSAAILSRAPGFSSTIGAMLRPDDRAAKGQPERYW